MVHSGQKGQQRTKYRQQIDSGIAAQGAEVAEVGVRIQRTRDHEHGVDLVIKEKTIAREVSRRTPWVRLQRSRFQWHGAISQRVHARQPQMIKSV